MTTDSLTLTARTPDDVLAMVPIVLGFTPERSVAMLTFGAPRPFHARVDLPAGTPVDPDDVTELVASLLDPARRHRVRRVFFVVYSADGGLARSVARALGRAFERAGIGVIETLRADGERWWPAIGSRPGVPAWGVPYDVSAHPFLARAVVEGRVTHGSREELRGTLASDPARVAGVVAALAELSGAPPPMEQEAAWVAALVARHIGDRTPPGDAEVARLLRAVLDPTVRDAAWTPMTGATARDHVHFWTDVVRRCPGPLLAAPAALLAYAAWQSGQGALAWCALDRSAEADPDYALAGLIAQALTHAVPPETWGEE
jgi:hypothetical protein